ncbi:MAG TPA: hypothetical protein ENG61_01560 [Candidatus Korarchaeota archaeon]|nr:hypothetical protein [Candidatus Korarchaeota archaeon]
MSKRSSFVFPWMREKLYREIRDLGLYVRMHGYEYLIADDRRIVALLFLEPWIDKAELRVLVPEGELVEKVLSKIRLLDQHLNVEVIYLPPIEAT